MASHDIIDLNIGGTRYTATRATLTTGAAKGSMLARLVSGEVPAKRDSHGAIFVDRRGDRFANVLEYLRNGHIFVDPHAEAVHLIEEFDFWGMPTAFDFGKDIKSDLGARLRELQTPETAAYRSSASVLASLFEKRQLDNLEQYATDAGRPDATILMHNCTVLNDHGGLRKLHKSPNCRVIAEMMSKTDEFKQWLSTWVEMCNMTDETLRGIKIATAVGDVMNKLRSYHAFDVDTFNGGHPAYNKTLELIRGSMVSAEHFYMIYTAQTPSPTCNTTEEPGKFFVIWLDAVYFAHWQKLYTRNAIEKSPFATAASLTFPKPSTVFKSSAAREAFTHQMLLLGLSASWFRVDYDHACATRKANLSMSIFKCVTINFGDGKIHTCHHGDDTNHESFYEPDIVDIYGQLHHLAGKLTHDRRFWACKVSWCTPVVIPAPDRIKFAWDGKDYEQSRKRARVEDEKKVA